MIPAPIHHQRGGASRRLGVERGVDWPGALRRSLVASILLGALSFFVSLLLGIAALVVRGFVVGSRPDMSLAYRHIAAPVALAALPVAFVAHLVWERRNSSRT